MIAYAIAGRVDIDFEKEPLATLDNGKQVILLFNLEHHAISSSYQVFLRDIWPTREEIQKVETEFVIPRMFSVCYSHYQIVM